jgi:hypothetical protein
MSHNDDIVVAIIDTCGRGPATKEERKVTRYNVNLSQHLKA